jgi:radical SAM superfamily enzyme YgiQ (UPF0313 family)
MKTQILLGAINGRWTHHNLAIRYLAQVIRSFDQYTVQLMDWSINQSLQDLLDDICCLQPQIIMLSTYIWNAHTVSLLIPEIKLLYPDSCLILGGPEVSYSAHTWIERFPQIDAIVSGPGELALAELCASNFTLPTSKIIHAKTPDFSTIPLAWQVGDIENLAKPYLYYESSRGCPYHCSYCLSSRSDQQLQSKEFTTVQSELSRILAEKPLRIKFVDRTFNANRDRARQIWQWIIAWRQEAYPVRKNEWTHFHFEIRPDLLEEQDFALLENVAPELFHFEIGIQSTLDRTQNLIDRKMNINKALHAIAELKKRCNVSVHIDLIAGLPEENLDDIMQSFDTIWNLQPDHIQLGFLKGLPGTKLRDHAISYELVFQYNPPYRIIRSKTLSHDELLLLRKIVSLSDALQQETVIKRSREIVSTSPRKSAFIVLQNLVQFAQNHAWDLHTKDSKKVMQFLEEYQASSTRFYEP